MLHIQTMLGFFYACSKVIFPLTLTFKVFSREIIKVSFKSWKLQRDIQMFILVLWINDHA